MVNSQVFTRCVSKYFASISYKVVFVYYLVAKQTSTNSRRILLRFQHITINGCSIMSEKLDIAPTLIYALYEGNLEPVDQLLWWHVTITFRKCFLQEDDWNAS
jgi:hypothetical protein